AIGALQLIIGISALLFIPTIDFVYPFSQFLSTQLAADSWWGTTGVRFIIAMAIMLIPTVAMGATFPLAVRCFTSTVTKLGSGIGTVYAVNTIGSIVGSLLAGFVLIPLLNVRLAITVVLLINLLLAVAVFNHEGREDSIIRSWLRPATILLALLAILVADRSPMILASVEFQGIQKRYNLLFSSEGAEASLAVIEDKINGERELNINGESTASTIYQDMLVHKLLGHLPALFHPNPQDFLVVGFGLGATAYASTLYPGSSVDCVELVPDEVATAPFFAKQNHDVLNAPNFQLILGDGREYIKLTNTKYDIISFNAIHPKISPALYTEDFYRLCRRVLRDDGLIVAWMPPNAINQSEFWSLAKTFQNVFPNCSFWYVNPSHFLLLASPEPIDFNWQRLESRLAIPSIRNDLAETKVAEPYELLSNFVIANGELAALVVAAPINSDNLPVIEFSQVRTVTVNVEAMSAVLKNWRTIYPYLSQLPDSSQTAAIKDKLSLAIQVKKLVAEGQLRSWLGLYTQARQFFQRALAYQPENGNALYMLELINNQQAELEKLVQLNPENFRAHKALADIHLEQNRLDEARVLLLQAIRVQPEYADAHHALGVIEFKLDQLIAAKVSFETAIEGRSDFSAPWFYLGLVHWKMGDANAALECFQQAAGIDPATALHHYWLGLALTQTGRIADARSSFETALMVDPSYQPAREALEGLVR
ncbi:MAG: fused MFS/spermidine synthase, partial [Candidatus Marinimicrobia bacterium]|nr:fused MFS/spermidine synthase [Candidatus Neomarinimicrobiota bacterium]